MCYIDRSSANLSVELADLCPHADTEFCIKVGEGLIHEEHFGVLYDRTSECYPLALAAGEVFRFAVAVFFQSEDFDRPVDFLFDLVCRHFHILQTVSDVFLNCHMRIESVVLEYH